MSLNKENAKMKQHRQFLMPGVLSVLQYIPLELFHCFISVENLAFNKRALISTSSRHQKRHISNSHIAQDRASQAVDGRLEQGLRFCTILDNLYGDVFAIDLGRKRKVSGVVIYTWQGEGQGKDRLNFWKLVYFIEFYHMTSQKE